MLKKMQLASAAGGNPQMMVMEPLEPDPASKIDSIQGKRLGPTDQPQYLVQWKRSSIKMDDDDQKDSGWIDRTEILQEHSNLGTVNQFELEFHKEITEIVTNTVEDSKKLVKIPLLSKKLKSNYPEFIWQHIPKCSGKPRSLVEVLKKVPHFQVKSSGGGTVATGKSLEHEKVNAARRKGELREMYVTLHQIIRESEKKRGGDTHIGCLGNVWGDAAPTFKDI